MIILVLLCVMCLGKHMTQLTLIYLFCCQGVYLQLQCKGFGSILLQWGPPIAYRNFHRPTDFKSIKYTICFSKSCAYLFCVALQTESSLSHLIVEVSTLHTIRHTHTHTHIHTVGLLWTNDHPLQIFLVTQHTRNKGDKHPCLHWDSNPQTQQSSDCRPTP